MPRQARLVYQMPDGRTHELPIDLSREATIGRHPQCTLTVNQASVSRRHAKIWSDGTTAYIEDMGSSNGTYVNNQRISRSAISAGDELRCGDFRLRFVEEESGTREVPAAVDVAPAEPLPKQPRVVGSIRSRVPRTPDAAPTPVGRIARSRNEQSPPPLPADSVEHQPVDPSMSGFDDPRAEVERLREEAGVWKRLYDDLRAQQGEGGAAANEERDRALADVAELRADVEARDRRIKELEGAVKRAEMQSDTQAESAVKLKEQLNAQLNQLEEYRRGKAELAAELAAAEASIGELRRAQEVSTTHEDELADQVNDLKRMVGQKEREIRGFQQELDMATYELKAAREENETLRLNLSADDKSRKELNTTVDHLRQVLGEKEGIIEQLEADLNRWKARASQAEDRAREEGGAMASRLTDDLTAARDELAEMTRRNAALEADLEKTHAALEEARGQSGNTRQLMDQLNELRRANRDLRNEMEAAKAQPAAPAVDDGRLGELEARLEAAERERHEAERLRVRVEGELRQAQEAVQRLQASAGAALVSTGGGGGGEDVAALRDGAVEVYERLNDLASDLRMNVELSKGYIGDLRPVVEVAEELRRQGVPGELGEQIRAAVEEADASLTMDSAEEAIRNAFESSRNFKKLMRTFRELLQTHGYGG
ncbi:MAG: FHA domain-containing protein [Myxococcales bacterium]|nr:FHA domain-containing protein [Myxococcales bacterium]